MHSFTKRIVNTVNNKMWRLTVTHTELNPVAFTVQVDKHRTKIRARN